MQCNHKGPYKREAGESKAKGDGMIEAEVGMMSSGDEAKGNGPRNASSSLWKLEEKRKLILSGASRKSRALLAPGF